MPPGELGYPSSPRAFGVQKQLILCKSFPLQLLPSQMKTPCAADAAKESAMDSRLVLDIILYR